MNQTRNPALRKMLTLGILSAIAFLLMAMFRIPVVMFLKYDPKDIIITFGGFLFGPMASFLMSIVVSFLEMLTVSDTGPIGLLMNVLSTCSFACTAAFIYKKHQSVKGAVAGLLAGVAAMVTVMLLWNYFITPLYMGVPREAVAEMLLPAFLPFNLLKGGLNAAITMLVYKPLVTALRKAGLVPPSTGEAGRRNTGVMLVAGVVLASCILLVLVMQGVL